MARRLVEGLFADRLAGEKLSDLKLVVAELVAGAYEHGKGAIRLKLTWSKDGVCAEAIHDGEDPVIGFGGPAADYRSRVVDAVSSEWGDTQGSVWAEVNARLVA